MKHLAPITCLLAALWTAPGHAQSLDITRSAAGFDETKRRLVEAVQSRGFTVVAQVDHAAGATAANLSLRPTHLVIFGNPRGGTPLMACAQAAGIDLPLKALIFEDASGAVQVGVNPPSLFVTRHQIGDCGAPALAAMGNALRAIVTEATR
jgi:uncharacterized protein (DUF302 family)